MRWGPPAISRAGPNRVQEATWYTTPGLIRSPLLLPAMAWCNRWIIVGRKNWAPACKWGLRYAMRSTNRHSEVTRDSNNEGASESQRDQFWRKALPDCCGRKQTLECFGDKNLNSSPTTGVCTTLIQLIANMNTYSQKVITQCERPQNNVNGCSARLVKMTSPENRATEEVIRGGGGIA